MSKVTVISLYPLPIEEYKPGLYPGRFHFDAAKDGDFTILPLEDSVYWVHFTEEDRPPIKVVTPANEVAESVIRDFVNNLYGINLEIDAVPGMFFIPEHLSKEAIKTKYKAELEAARVRQVRWYGNLVRLADDDWVNSGKQHRAISSIHRLACKSLNLEREWLVEVDETLPKYCPACRERVHPEAVICKCRFVLDEAKFSKMKFAGETK